MTSSLALADAARPVRNRRRDRAMVAAWLYGVAALVFLMVIVGGATRLTDSGLSITEWKPIHGVIPPLSAAEWEEEFAKYREIPEYKLVNRGMDLAGFKTIFWWEWAHRFLGRFIGVAFLLPFVFFLATGRIERSMAPKLVGLFVLGGAQGAIGWWMVASGLVERTDVSQYRLAIHLTLACVIFAAILWVARGLSPDSRGGGSGGASAWWLLGLILLQIFLGGLVAGLDAGLVANTWPLMDGAIIPDGLVVQEPAWRNLFENPVTVQFVHRLVAYLLFGLTALRAIRLRGSRAGAGASLLFAAVAVQAGLGIATVVTEVPLSFALLHQAGALAVLVIAVFQLPVAAASREAPA